MVKFDFVVLLDFLRVASFFFADNLTNGRHFNENALRDYNARPNLSQNNKNTLVIHSVQRVSRGLN